MKLNQVSNCNVNKMYQFNVVILAHTTIKMSLRLQFLFSRHHFKTVAENSKETKQ